MTKASAFGRLFPASLFLVLSVLMSVLWRSDPVLMVLAVSAGATSAAWLIITIVEVARMLRIEPSQWSTGPGQP